MSVRLISWVLVWTVAGAGSAIAEVQDWPTRIARKAKRGEDGKKLKLAKRFSTKARNAMLRRGTIWFPIAPEQVDLVAGPDFFPRKYDRHEVLRCDYLDEETGGTTPKFKCRVASGPNEGRKIKVKFRTDYRTSDEVHTEIAASRLLWALGFGADYMYPIDRVICRGCPENPHTGGEIVPFQAFDHVVIEEKFGKKVETAEDKGWRWDELESIGATRALSKADRRAQLDALKLFAAMLRHYDNKGENQRLACLKADIAEDGTCLAPHFLLHDSGGTFGPGWNGNGPAFAKWWRQQSINRPLSNKYNLEGWSKAHLWKDKAACVAELGALPSAVGGLRDPKISEAGRAFLADRLLRLKQNPQGLGALFGAARFDRPRAWAEAFWSKADEIIGHTCPE